MLSLIVHVYAYMLTAANIHFGKWLECDFAVFRALQMRVSKISKLDS